MSNTATENDYLSIGGGVNLFDDEARFILKNRNKLQELRVQCWIQLRSKLLN